MDMYQKRKIRAEKKNSNQEEKLTKVGINWYPGHMAKTKRMIKENLNLVDIIYEVIDARIPSSSKIIDIEEIIKNKPRILILTKYDLCDKTETDKFIKKYETLGYHVLKFNLNSDNLNKLIDLSKEILNEKIIKQKEKGLKKNTIRALVIGIPNVGKSTLINKLAAKSKVQVGNKPGVTKNISWIKVQDGLEIMDTPGILWPKLDQEKEAYNLASMTAIKEDILPTDKISVYIITMLYKYYPEILKKEYNVEDISSFEDVFTTIGKKYGLISRGGEVDYDKVETLIINDIKKGKIKNITFDRY